MSDPSLGFALTRQGTHVQVIAKGDGGVSLVDLRTLVALDFDALNFGALLELLDRAAMPGQARLDAALAAADTRGEGGL